MRLALVHDFLVQRGGAEEVVKVLHDIWPEAPIYTLVYDSKSIGSLFSNETSLRTNTPNKLTSSKLVSSISDIRPSFIQRLPLGKRKYQWFLPLMPTAIERHDLMEYDVVLSSTSAFAKGVITSPETLHISYCHTPTRYLWTDTHRYTQSFFIHPLLSYLRLWDRHAADRVDHFIANSKNVQSRIRKYYRRDSDVLHPPVDTFQFKEVSFPLGNETSSSTDPKSDCHPEPGEGSNRSVSQFPSFSSSYYFLAGGRLVAYKRFDIVVRAFNRLGLPLKIFGTGPALTTLQRDAKPNIEFLGFVDNKTRAELYRNCIAFIHPQEEDFGLTTIESMASGRPVIAYARGGALETVKAGETGVFFDEQIWEALADCVLRFDPTQFDAEKIRTHAMQWDIGEFKKRMKEYVEEKWKAFQQQVTR